MIRNTRRLCLALLAASAAYAAPVRLQCERLVNPLGIDSRTPRFSWQNDDPQPNWRQAAYRILVSAAPDGKADVWDSGRRESSESLDIPYAGPALESRKRYYWTVRVWDPHGKSSDAAAPAWFEMGLLAPSDWTAQWISWPDQSAEDRAGIRWISIAAPDPAAPFPRPRAAFRLRSEIPATVRDVAVFVESPRGFELRVNGQLFVSRNGWASFNRQDITAAVVPGQNIIEVVLPAAANPRDAAAGNKLAALLKIVDLRGRILRYPSGDRWEARIADADWTPAVAGDAVGAPVAGSPAGILPQPAAILRREFNVEKPVRSARLYVTALGSYQAFLNGKHVGDDVLTPEFTDYRKRILYQTYDVAPLLIEGRNAVAALLGDGWFLSGQWSSGDRGRFYAPPPRLLAQLRIEYTDGTHTELATDGSWKSYQSPIFHSEIYAGEIYDARLELPAWFAGYDDGYWSPVLVSPPPPAVLAAQMAPPPRVVATIKPVSIKPVAEGVYIVDMGQNMVGWPVLRVEGPGGTRIRMRTAEVLNPDGTLYRDNLRNADSTDTYILRGSGPEEYRPHFTFHGFRYLELSGFPVKPTPDSIQGEVISSLNSDPTGHMETSSELINRFWKTGIWGQLGNFLSIPTDCPQRDERQGWMGDAEIFWRTGSYNFDIASFGRQWMHSVVDDQTPDGAFTNTVPVVTSFQDGAPGWGDAGVIVPWTAWMQYGDKKILEDSWAAMQRWMDFIQKNNPDFLRRKRTGNNYGDWLAPDRHTPPDLIDTAYWALIAHQMADIAQVLGKKTDAKRYLDLLTQIRLAFDKEFVKPDGTVGPGSQTASVLALYMDLLPKAQIPLVVDKLVKDIEAHDWHLTTGFLGTPFLLFTLADHDRLDVAYRLLLNETYPSWGYMLSKGATTWWERWNGDTGDPSMNSYNHYAFGSVMAWVYRYVAGIDTAPTGPGFHEIVIRPRPDARITHARGEYDSAYGKIVSDWSDAPAGPFTLSVTIPPNTHARVYLPAGPNAQVTEDGKPVKTIKEGDSYVVDTGSGSYKFEVK